MLLLKIVILLLFTLHTFASFSHYSLRVLVSGAGVVIISALFSWHIPFPWRKDCELSWMNFNPIKFESYLRDHLFGQHLVIWTVTNALKAHISKTQPKKALVMSFHGWTGSGKNYVSKMIANALYEEGSKSEFVHWYIATRDFPHLTEAKKYRDKLHREISEFSKNCGQSLFIFDEMDKMGPGVIDAIKPYIDFYDEVGGIDYRKNIFIFLSNAGGSEITRVAFNFWLYGKDREDMNMRDIEPLINQGAFNEIGGLQHSEIVEKNLIDMYVPFLPLEMRHVRKCIEYELKMREQNIKKHIVDKVIDQIIFYPPQFELFSVSGCKKIAHKVDIFGTEE